MLLTRDKKKWFFRILGSSLAVFALGAFGWYVSNHPELISILEKTAPRTIVTIVALYAAWFLSLTCIVHATFKICGYSLAPKELLLLNAYSTVVNFFIPGQSGIALRGAYMKKRSGFPIRSYLSATVMYYICFATISGLFLLVPSVRWWLVLALVLVALCGLEATLIVYKMFQSKWSLGLKLRVRSMLPLLGWTFVNCVIQAAIYFVELKAVLATTRLGQAISYTGAANFAQFVALTPGAVGIRESFLLLAQRLHGIPANFVLAASVIDRGSFLVFMTVLFLITLGAHAKFMFAVKDK